MHSWMTPFVQGPLRHAVAGAALAPLARLAGHAGILVLVAIGTALHVAPRMAPVGRGSAALVGLEHVIGVAIVVPLCHSSLKWPL